MNKYCFEVSEIIKKTTKVRVDTEDLIDAENILETAYEKGLIEFKEINEEEPEFEYEIDSDSCTYGETFDDEQFSDEGIQLFGKGVLDLVVTENDAKQAAFVKLDNQIETWSKDEKNFVLWQLLKGYGNDLEIPEDPKTIEEFRQERMNHELWVACSKLVDMLNFELWR